ncbi:acetate kinase [Siculibacillus lacustris]|uniref:Acetate kinase n=1 Tax=Siculibacillus lacustris TaxID=1549641 RepID=A0A4Q9VSV4_9HYPH|nr:acetate kinase [Siculibacillus lacustris]TBW38746.1 acetate kinase [Siculibacillus lacustris]
MSSALKLVLVINCGSSSLKFSLLPVGSNEPLMSGLAECLGLADARLVIKKDGEKTTSSLLGGAHGEALASLLAHIRELGLLESIRAVGHRMVHGGERFTASALITPEILTDIQACNPLAPLHNPANLLGVRAALASLPGIPQVAVFDTAFHQTMPPEAYTYAIPQKYYRELGVRRYGFHGTSHRYVAEEAVRLLALDPADHGIVIAHLGNGASATAVLNGASVDTTMGLTPLEGLVMGTRAGDVDFGAIAHIARAEGFDLDRVETLLNKESGLLGISELSSDCRALEAAIDDGHHGAKLALDVFVHRLARHVGGLATALPRFDALIFTGGIGENSRRIRAMTIARLAVFGLVLDPAANDATVGGKAGKIAVAPSGLVAAVVPTDEESMIARDTARIAGLSA